MKPIESFKVLLKYMDLQNPRADEDEGQLLVDESGAYWLYSDGCYHRVTNENPFKNEIPGQLIFINGKLYMIANDGQLILYGIPNDIPNEDKTGGA